MDRVPVQVMLINSHKKFRLPGDKQRLEKKEKEEKGTSTCGVCVKWNYLIYLHIEQTFNL